MTTIKMCVFRSRDRYRIVNVKDFRGVEEADKIYCWGFNGQGEPVIRKDFPPETIMQDIIPYGFSGPKIGGVDMQIFFDRGVMADKKRLLKYDAIACQMGRSGGLGIHPTIVEQELKKLTEQGVETVYIYKLSSTCGMMKPLGFEDRWIFSGKPPNTDDFDLEKWNKFLASIKSPWRLWTKSTRNLLRRIELENLKSEG